MSSQVRAAGSHQCWDSNISQHTEYAAQPWQQDRCGCYVSKQQYRHHCTVLEWALLILLSARAAAAVLPACRLRPSLLMLGSSTTCSACALASPLAEPCCWVSGRRQSTEGRLPGHTVTVAVWQAKTQLDADHPGSLGVCTCQFVNILVVNILVVWLVRSLLNQPPQQCCQAWY